MSKRGRGEGSIYQRADGRWCGALTIGETADGAQRRRYVYGATRKAVAAALGELASKAAAGGLVEPSHLTMRDLCTRWLATKARTVRASTLADYTYTWEKYILPAIGHTRVQKLGPLLIEALLDGLGKKYSPRMVRQVRVLIHGALSQAVRWGLVERNQALAVDPPPKRSQPPEVWAPDDVRAFLEAAASSRYYAAFYVAITSGLRRGELLGLRAGDVDELAGSITIRRTVLAIDGKVTTSEPKTAASRRVVHLAEDALEVLAARVDQVERERAKAVKVGRWAGLDDPYLWGTHLGRPTNPSELLRAFTRLQALAGVRRIRFHDLRHTYASLALRDGVPLPTVSARMGHSSTTITSDIYAHVVPGDSEAAARPLAELLTDGSCQVAVKSGRVLADDPS